jgi:spectinomycin phosphotransferase
MGSVSAEATQVRPTLDELAAAFALRDLEPRSLTPWARVFRARTHDGHLVVVKRTATKATNAAAMAAWTRAARASGFPVVAPADVSVANPQQLGPDWWVVYPWVSGRAYGGTLDEIRMAADLLGRQHTLEVDASALRRYTWPEPDAADVEVELAKLARRVPDPGLLRGLADRWRTRSLPALRSADLLHVGVSSDFKASNLVFGPEGPVLVDPDNGGCEPRLFDLALAVVLFHHECPGAPGRLFTSNEWSVFHRAYEAHVPLTGTERRLWPAALDHMLWDEGSWALDDNDDAAWGDPRQGAFLRDLATTSPDRFPLD